MTAIIVTIVIVGFIWLCVAGSGSSRASRWTLYILRGDTPAYALHQDSAVRLAGSVMGNFCRGKRPAEPWKLQLTFNATNAAITLRPEHFVSGDYDLTPALIAEIREIDPGYMVPGAEPIIEELPSRRRIPTGLLTEANIGDHIARMLDVTEDLPEEQSLRTILDEIFIAPVIAPSRHGHSRR